MLEANILEQVLRFKISPVTFAEVAYLIVCTASATLGLEPGCLSQLL